MKIMIITQYFWPESFRINDLAQGLKERGNEIHVITGKPNYPSGKFNAGYNFINKRTEDWNGIKLHRSPLFRRRNGSGLYLMLNYLSFAFFATIRALFLKGKYDLIFVYEPSPITVGIPAIILSKIKKIPVYFWVQDLWPESISSAGQIKNIHILNSIDKLTRWIYKNSKLVLVQSNGFREYILNQGVEDDKIIFYPNSTEAVYQEVVPRPEIKKLIPVVPFSIMFAGNIGEAQDFDTILEVARLIKLKTLDIHFIILGDGRKKNYVLNKAKEYDIESNFHLLGSHPYESMPDFFACADALLVSLKKNRIFSLTIPAKVQSYLACSKPVIAALDGEGAKLIKESNAGFVAPSGDIDILREKILELYSLNKTQREELGKNGRNYFENNFEREMLISRLITIFKQK
jgi:glycosyltransferase involved in cell wall biosynthesis